jgi:SAM-dependent methyltransferase
MQPEAVEISDLIVDYDPRTLARRPVRKEDVVARYRAIGRRSAIRVVEAIPDRQGVLDADAVDATLIRCHCEMQRLWEEFQVGLRVLTVLRPMVSALRESGATRPIRVCDVGCGLGYIVRWLAKERRLGADVELVGADYNAALVAEARALAAREDLACRFVVANAFRLEAPAAVYISTGVIHHFRGSDLVSFFREQAGAAEARAFAHFDAKATPVAGLGSWIFHHARMREPLARHDGTLSAVRAHPGPILVRAAREGAGPAGFRVGLFDGCSWRIALVRIFNAVVGIRPALAPAFLSALGADAPRLGELS